MNIFKSIHRRVLGLTNDDKVIAPKGYAVGGEGKPSFEYPSPSTVAVFDDFLGDVVADEWAAVEGDTGYSQALVTASGGVFRITGSETQAVAPTAASALTHGLFKNWKLDSARKAGKLRLTARVKSEVVSATAETGRPQIFVGFSDSGGAEMPAYDTGAGVISNAADLVGFLFSASASSTNWQAVAAKSTAGDSGDQKADLSVAPAANTYTTLELEVKTGDGDTGGNAHFIVDGIKRGTINSPVNSATALTPWIGMWIQDTGVSMSLDIDYVAISQPRDTGF